MIPDPALIDLFQRLAVALGVGFLVGIERGWRHRAAPEGSRAAGLRTYAAMGLSGGVAGALLPAVGAVGFAALAAAFAVAFIVFKVRESERDQDLSATGTIAGLLVFALGAYAMVGDLRIAAASGVALAALLAFKYTLHDWLNKVTWNELRSALLILAATAIALPLLPDRAIDPSGAINPRELWLLTILVAGASFAGYVAVRALGGDVGVMAGAAVGALVSSTVVAAELGRRVGVGQTPPAIAAAAGSLAAAVSVARVGVFVAAAAQTALPLVAPALVGAGLVFLVGAWALNRSATDGGQPPAPSALRSPLDLGAVVRFALLLGAVTIGGRLIGDAFGQAGLLPFAVAAGLADVDAAAMAASSLVHRGLDPAVAANMILSAVLVNSFSKAGIAAATGGWRYGGMYLAVATAAALAGGVVWLFVAPYVEPMFVQGASLAPRLIG